MPRFTIDFYEDEHGDSPVLRWLCDELTPTQRRARPESNGERILLRNFCHAYGDRIVLLLGGYDKGADPSPKCRQREIASARKRLKDFQRRRQ